MEKNNKSKQADCCRGCLNGAPGQNPACRTKMLMNKEAVTTTSSTKKAAYEN